MLPLPSHPDPTVDRAFRDLQNALISWERATGRDSLLIFREAAGRLAELAPQPSAVCIRLDNGIPLGPSGSDLSDQFLLQHFTDTSRGP